jgi:hypothetical protein
MDIHRPPLSSTARRKQALCGFDWDGWFSVAVPMLPIELHQLARDPVYMHELVRHLLHATPRDIKIAVTEQPNEELVCLAQACFFDHRYQAVYFCEYYYRYAGRNTLGVPRHEPAPLERFDRYSPTVSDDVLSTIVDDVLMGNPDMYPFVDDYLRALADGDVAPASAAIFIRNAHMDENALAGYEISANRTVVDVFRIFARGAPRHCARVHYTAEHRGGACGYVMSLSIKSSLYRNNHHASPGHYIERHVSD